MSLTKDDQQLKRIVRVATSFNSYLAQSSNGDEEPMAPDEAELSHRCYTSFYSDPSANEDENLVITDTIKLGHTVNPDVKEKDYLVVLAPGEEELVTTNAVKLWHSNDYLVPLATVDMNLVTTNVLALGHASDYLVPIATNDKDLVANDVLKLDHASNYLFPIATGDKDVVANDVLKLGHASDYLVPLATGDKNLVTTNVLELGHASDYLSVLTSRDYELVESNQANIGCSDDVQYMHTSPVSTQFSTTTVDNCYSRLSAAKPEGKCNLACFKVLFLHETKGQ